jgi:hypothetical protein
MSGQVAFRFIVADVNLRRKRWYDERGFMVNRAQVYHPDEPDLTTISMRLDLREMPPQ